MNNWQNIDATDQQFGRLAARVATILMGKDEPTYQTHVHPQKNVVVVNCAQLKVGMRLQQKPYYRHSGYLGNLKKARFVDQPLSQRFKAAVAGMLPKNKLARAMIKNLHCYEGSDHPHKGQVL